MRSGRDFMVEISSLYMAMGFLVLTSYDRRKQGLTLSGYVWRKTKFTADAGQTIRWKSTPSCEKVPM
jgi:hypothetical protein